MFLEPLFAHQFLVHRAGEAGEHGIPIAGFIIDGDVPLGDDHLAAHRDRDRLGEDLVRDPHMGLAVVEMAQGDDAHPVFGFLDSNVRARVVAQQLGHRDVGIGGLVAELLAIAVGGVFVFEETVQERGVCRVDADLHRLQPIALPQTLEGKDMGVGGAETVEIGEFRRLTRPHIGEDDAVLFDHGVRGGLDLLVHLRAFRLARLFDALAVAVEMPAVEGAAQPVILEPPETEVSAAMRAGTVNQAQLSVTVAEQNEVFAQQFDRNHGTVAGQFIGKRGGLPVAAHDLAGFCAGAGAGEGLVEFLADHLAFLLGYGCNVYPCLRGKC